MSELDDASFLAAFEAGQRPGGRFQHVDHVRLAWILLRRHGAALGEERIAAGIRRFAAAQGAPGLYHDTLTRAWVRLVAAATASSPGCGTVCELLAAHPELGDKAYLFRFYSPQALSAPAARTGWVDPDLAPLPAIGAAHPPRARRLRAAFLLGAAADALAVLPMLVPSLASLLWGFEDHGAPYRFAMGYAASLMLAWTGLLIWASRRPAERAFVAPLTVLVLYGLAATEVAAVVSGALPAWRMAPTWALQAALLWLFARAYHGRDAVPSPAIAARA